MPIVDDIVKGIKKFGDDVIEGAKNGPGKAARIKDTGTIKVNRARNTSYNVSNIINKTMNNYEDIHKRGMKDFDSLDDASKKIFNSVNERVKSVGNGVFNDDVRNVLRKEIGESNAKTYQALQKMDPAERLKEAQRLGIDLGTKTSNLSNAKNIDFSDAYIGGDNSLGRRVGDFTGGGLYGSVSAYKNMADGKKSIVGALKEGHSVVNDAGEKVISGKKVAGTATTVAAAGTLGNRVFRNEYGELDVPVVPFI